MSNFVLDDTLSILSRQIKNLHPLLVIDEAETNLFRQESTLLEEAGIWADFLRKMLSHYEPYYGQACNLRWGAASDSKNGRFIRWIDVEYASQKFVAALVPFVYSRDDNSTYVDRRFIVAATEPEVGPIVLLFKDFILGENHYE